MGMIRGDAARITEQPPAPLERLHVAIDAANATGAVR